MVFPLGEMDQSHGQQYRKPKGKERTKEKENKTSNQIQKRESVNPKSHNQGRKGNEPIEGCVKQVGDNQSAGAQFTIAYSQNTYQENILATV